ncbi:Hpt domain-containing protein [Vibrio maerlii]|uniref:Hpt domain-containing protein n=1 Tax=Vibrio maerlii TaxID=2231648 RepID=UPI000E3C941A|nr:Hpt domain-containing protein [Vibrio maerlii]
MTLLNQGKVDKLSSEIGAENVPMLLDIFIGELGSYKTKLQELNGDEQIQQLKEISHALKSSAASFGADALRDIAQSIDLKGKQFAELKFEVEGNELCAVMSQTEQAYSDYRATVTA